jgi:cystathionine beta-lyase
MYKINTKYDFTKSTIRQHTNAEKYTQMEKKFGTTNIIPLWIADMDIDSPIFVQKALEKRIQEPIFGYEMFPKSAFMAQIQWLKTQHNIEFDLQDIFYTHSIVSAMNVAIEAFSNVGDNIIVQTPVYAPFFKSVQQQNRTVLYNDLIKDKDGIYKMDLQSLKKKIDHKTKMMMFCNPQNPTSRVWNKEELEELVDICVKNNIVIFSDEIHCDLVYKPFHHIPIASIKGAKNITLSAYGIGKSFNLSGLSAGTIYIQDESLKKKYQTIYDKYHFASGNILSHIAFEVAYKYGYEWIEELKEHLYSNYLKLKKVCEKYPTLLKLTPIQSTYLAWIDCSGFGQTDQQIEQFFIAKAKLGLNKGVLFGKAGTQHFRLNFAISTEMMDIVVKQLDEALGSK